MSDRCPVCYEGDSYPSFRGVRCTLPRGHEGRHHAPPERPPLSWWTPEEKVAVRARRAGKAVLP